MSPITQLSRPNDGIKRAIASRKTGSASAAPIQNRRVMSVSS